MIEATLRTDLDTGVPVLPLTCFNARGVSFRTTRRDTRRAGPDEGGAPGDDSVGLGL
jgi:hypothetical protein